MTKTQEKVGRIPKIYKLPDDGVSKGYVDRIRVFNRFCRDKMGNKEIDDKTVIAFFEEMKLRGEYDIYRRIQVSEKKSNIEYI